MKGKADESRSVYMVSRRDMYLLIWGGVYITLGSYVAFTFGSYLWASMFWVSGMISLLAALYNSPRKKAVAFAVLTGASALRGVSYLVPVMLEVNADPDITRGAILLYLGITLSHILVSGWYTGDIIETVNLLEKEDRQGD